MFDLFGEMGSAEELNMLAENLFNEGDMDSIKTLAKENGIPEEYAEMYISGDIPMLTDKQTAAIGKLEIETAELKPETIMIDWIEYIKGQVMENEAMAAAVRSKEKSLAGCIGALLKWSWGHQQTVDKKITEAAGVKARVTLGIPGMAEAKKIIKEYYGG